MTLDNDPYERRRHMTELAWVRAQLAEYKDRIEELEGMLEKEQDPLACAHARIAQLEKGLTQNAEWLIQARARIAELEGALRAIGDAPVSYGSTWFIDFARAALRSKP